MAGRKIFISYKYADANVQALPQIAGLYGTTTARHYVDALQARLDFDDHINKGEKDGESLADFKDGTIETTLKGKIYDSSLTILLLSPGMREYWCAEEDQWIPWEISWSLRELTRGGRTSGTNAMLAVALPDASGRYDYAVVENTCSTCHCRTWQTDSFFRIIRENMFNRKQPAYSACTEHWPATPPVIGSNHSFIYPVTWTDFGGNVGLHISIACDIRSDIDSYNLTKTP
jgi:hypothetical protein